MCLRLHVYYIGGNMGNRYSIEEIKKACELYDIENGDYPETEFEGFSVFEFLYYKLTGEKGCFFSAKYKKEKYKVAEMEYIKDE